jgi:hypothetical protein
MSKKVPVYVCLEINACCDVGESMSGWVSYVISSLGSVALANRLTGAMYHCFLMNGLPVFLEHVPLHQRQTRDSCMMGHHLVFSALPDIT